MTTSISSTVALSLEVEQLRVAAVLGEQDDIQVVAVAVNGLEAVQQARQTKPDVALLDIAMPILNGLDAGRQVKQILPVVKVVYLTMNTDPEENHHEGVELPTPTPWPIVTAVGIMLIAAGFVTSIVDTPAADLERIRQALREAPSEERKEPPR